MGKSSKTPAAPDYSGIAEQQSQQNQAAWNQQNQANRPTQVNNQGTSSWTQDENGNWTQNQFYNPQQAGIYDAQQNNQQGIANAAGNMLNNFDTSQISLNKDMPQVGQYNQQATDLFNQLAQPQLDRQRAAKEAQMAAMGLGLGSGRAYDTQQELLNDSENRSGMMGAQAGIQQGNTMFGQGMQLNSQGNQNILNERTANLGQLSGLMGLQQNLSGAPNMGGFNAAGAFQGADLMGAANSQYQTGLDATNAQNADNAAKQQAAMTAVAAAATIF